MPRRARIDATGAIHHIIIRGIERKKIFRNDADRESFIERLGKIATETKTARFGWSSSTRLRRKDMILGRSFQELQKSWT